MDAFPACCGDTKLRREFLEKVNSDKGRPDFLAGRAAWSEGKGTKGFGRPLGALGDGNSRKRSRGVSAEEDRSFSEQTCIGVFWPKEVYTEYFKKQT